MKRNRIVLLVSLIVAIGIPVALLVHRSQRTIAIEEYLTDRGFVRQARCDRSGALIEQATEVTCYAGRIRGGTATLAFVTTLRPAYVPQGAQYVGDSHVALYLDVSSTSPLPWPAPRVERVGSVTVLVWVGPWTVADARSHLDEVEQMSASPR